MGIGQSLKRLYDIKYATVMSRSLKARESWSRGQLMEYQLSQLRLLVGFARRQIPFYRDLYRQLPDEDLVRLEELPVIEKKTVMENYDAFLADQRVKLADLHDYIESVDKEDYYLGKYTILTTSGSSGHKGIFVYDRRARITVLAAIMRLKSFAGLKPAHRMRVSLIGSGSPHHLSSLAGSGIDFGFHAVQKLNVTMPIGEIVKALNEFQPEYIKTYSSIAGLLAQEQIDGKLNIHPLEILTGAEVLTVERLQKIRDVWDITPFNGYSATEGVMAVDCLYHEGLHVFEDLCIVEVVDSDNHHVADGTPGHKILITNLFNYTQPLIRYELPDMLTMSVKTCQCGRPFRCISHIDGRNDDIICLESLAGGLVPISSIFFHILLDSLKEIKEYQVVHDTDGIHVYIIPARDASLKETASTVERALSDGFKSQRVVIPGIFVRFIEEIAREPEMMGKFKPIKSLVAGPGCR
ncbi:MAG: phenylacetate-CoA ligase [Syntrophus sp. SKADARSKE-3]|nr:phenylacetate-CoA ligase [Syntrophus sp. SKADARSKE-3]